MRSRTSRGLWLLLAMLAGCTGNCSQNAVVIAEEVQKLGRTVDTIEVFSDLNGDGSFSLDERGFVIDPRPTIRKIVRIRFLLPVSRAAVGEQGGTPISPLFLTFASLFDPAPDPWVVGVYFNDDPNDTDLSGSATTSVTYVLRENLIDPVATAIAIPVRITLSLERIDPSFKPAEFGFVLARQAFQAAPPPRISSFVPAPPGPAFLPGWGRPISQSDFGPGENLADVLARVDQNFVGATLAERVSPHEGIAITFDEPMTVMVASVTPSGGLLEPKGISLDAPTIAFATPFTVARSETSIGMAPDLVYEVTALSNWSTSGVNVPLVSGSQSEEGRFLMPNFDDALYAALKSQGYSNTDLMGESRYSFRTGPFRITSPAHNGNTNASSAPNGQFTARLQFARPTEGIAAPASVVVKLTPHGQGTTLSTVAMTGGIPDTIQQDGVVRSFGVTRHDIPIQLPTVDYDDVVELETTVLDGGGQELGHDKIKFHHDVIPPVVDPGVTITNTYSDSQLDKVCIVADCDIDHFLVTASPGGTQRTLRRSDAIVSTCAANRQQYCFDRVDLALGFGFTEEQPLELKITAVDDQGNTSATEVTVPIPRPDCQLEDKFVGADGKFSAIGTKADGTPAVAWFDGLQLKYAEGDYGGGWSQHRSDVGSRLLGGHVVGGQIDLAFDPTDHQPIICYLDATAADSAVLHVVKFGGTQWSELSQVTGALPLGCALTVVGINPIVAWSEPGTARWGSVVAPSLGQELPKVPGTPVASPQIWDVDIAAHNGRIYFAYRTTYPDVNLFSAPGWIVAGYFDGAGTHAEVVCGDDVTEVPRHLLCLGLAPKLLVDDDGVALAAVMVSENGAFPFLSHTLSVLWAPEPDPGNNIFIFDGHHEWRESNMQALHGSRDADGNSLQPTGTVGIGRQPDHALAVGWTRTGLGDTPGLVLLGKENVAVTFIDTNSGFASTREIDRRVGGGNSMTEYDAVDVHLSESDLGFQIVYRNPSTGGGLQYASEHRSIPVALTPGTFACPNAYRTATITEAQLNLRYLDPAPMDPVSGKTFFWTPECAQLAAMPLERPWGLHGEQVGGPNVVSLLQDVANGIELRDGRTPLRMQKGVCLPISASTGEPDASICDPNTNDSQSFLPPSEGQFSNVVVSPAPTGVPPSTVVTYPDFFAAMLNCAPSNQIIANFPGPIYQCVGCPLAAPVYDPQTQTCVPCADFQYRDATSAVAQVGQKVRFLSSGTSFGANRLACLSCPAVSGVDRARGATQWSVTADGTSCSRCADGSVLYECLSNEDCQIFPDSHCAEAGAWNRANGPRDLNDHPARVCVRNCAFDSGCGANGSCDTSTHKCVDVNHHEVHPGTDLECRPIGCDECWKNDFCQIEADGSDNCPLNHRCYAESQADPVLTPACILRPVLSPEFEDVVCTFAPQQCAAIRRAIAPQREKLIKTLKTIKLPSHFDIGQTIPLYSSTVATFETSIINARIFLQTFLQDGVVRIRLDMSPAHIVTANTGGNDVLDTTTDGNWAIELAYALYTGRPGTNASQAYSALGFTLIGVSVSGTVVVPGPDIQLASAGPTIQAQIEPFASRLMENIVEVLGGLTSGPTGYLDSPNLLRCVIQPADAFPSQCHNVPPLAGCDGIGCNVDATCCKGYTCDTNEPIGAFKGSCMPTVQPIRNAAVDVPYDHKITVHYEACP